MNTEKLSSSFRGIDRILEKYIPPDDLMQMKIMLYGRSDDHNLELCAATVYRANARDFEVRGFCFHADLEESRKPRIVRVGAVQHSIVYPTTEKIDDQRKGIFLKIDEIIQAAADSNVNILCFQEAWSMPYAMCTREKIPWCEFAEDAQTGPSIIFLKTRALKYNMVIISPILERDTEHGDVLWNTAVVISNRGTYIGKHRKNHIPRTGAASESTYYMEGNTGHPVFETEFGKIAINICYGRHHPQNWMMFGINGAEIVFNPSATTVGLTEPMWGIEARNAAIVNNYFTVSINRVGTESFPREFTTGNSKRARKENGPFFGSTYVTAPNGCRTPSLSRNNDGLLIVEMDLNLCRQVKDYWGFRMTQRLDVYGKALTDAAKVNYRPQVIKDLLMKK